jgi:FK506-binding nuclear protein
LQHYQQPLDIVVGEDEKIFFKVSGNFTIHLTGNYVIPMDDGQAQLYDEDEEDEDYDLSPDEDELDMLEEGESESDELDDLEDPRVMEVDTDEDKPEAPKLVNNAAGKGKNKRPAPPSDDEEEPNLDDLMEKSLKAAEPAPALKEEPPKKLTKGEKKRLKKMKMLDGEAITTSTASTTPAATSSKPAEPVKKENSVNGEKKVQFAKNLEQGPTPSATSSPATKSDNKKPDAKDSKATLGVKNVNGVTVDDRKLGTGPAAKKGNKVGMRYIGKLEDGKVFDGKHGTAPKQPKDTPSERSLGDANNTKPGSGANGKKKRTKKENHLASSSAAAK